MDALFSLIAGLFWLAFWIVLIVGIVAAFQFASAQADHPVLRIA